MRGHARSQFRRRSTAGARQFSGRFPQRALRRFDLLFEPEQFVSARLDLPQTLRRLRAEGDDFVHRAAIFPLQGFEERDAIFELRETPRVEIELICVVLERRGHFFEFRHAACMPLGHGRGTAVDAFQIAQEPPNLREPMQDGIVRFREPGECLVGKLEQPAPVRGRGIAREQFLLLAFLQLRRLDLADLMPQEIQLPFERGFVTCQRPMLGNKMAVPAKMLGASRALRLGAGIRIEERELLLARKQRLMIVRPMKIDERFAQFFQDGQRRRAAVDELPVRPRCREDPFHEKLPVFARLDALFLEPRIDLARLPHVEDRLDRATLRARAEQ